MTISLEEIKKRLQNAGLKITPQRLAILDAVYKLNNHPSADQIIEQIRSAHPGVATGTVYKVLDTLVNVGLVRRVRTDRDAMRYDGVTEIHHHLYCEESERIEDFMDGELDRRLRSYFQEKAIPGFQIGEIRLQINGKFMKPKPTNSKTNSNERKKY
jgi:Fur family peroxide stress response transcriptional regulator